jgi:hypothetical protein
LAGFTTFAADDLLARIDAGECIRNMTATRARELENIGHQ